VLTAACALILVVIGGWGAITERSSLIARIAELESAATKTPQRGDLSGSEEQSLREENQRLSNQLDELRDQLSNMAEELAELETALSSKLATSQPPESVATMSSNEVANTRTNQDQTVGDKTSDEANISGWFVNVAAYSQASAAQSWVDKLTASLDENIISSKVVVNEKTLYRVRVVGLANRATAQALASQLESSYNIGPLWVGKAETSANGISPEESSLDQTRPKPASSALTNATQEQPISNSPNATASQPVELRNFSNKGGWFIYIDTFSQSNDADAKAREIQSAGYDAKVAVEYRSGELFYRVQVVGINSREEGEAIAQALSARGDMPNLQLRQY
jgi:cell division septation protein DedD